MPNSPPRRRHTKRRRPKSPGPRVNLKKLREDLYADPEIKMVSPNALKKMTISKGGKRNMTRKLGPLPNNVEFVGFVKR